MIIQPKRRGFLFGVAGLLLAPSVVRPESIMRVAVQPALIPARHMTLAAFSRLIVAPAIAERDAILEDLMWSDALSLDSIGPRIGLPRSVWKRLA